MNVHRTSYLLISCRKTPEPTILKNTLGKRSLMPYPVFYQIAKEEDGWATEPIVRAAVLQLKDTRNYTVPWTVFS